MKKFWLCAAAVLALTLSASADTFDLAPIVGCAYAPGVTCTGSSSASAVVGSLGLVTLTGSTLGSPASLSATGGSTTYVGIAGVETDEINFLPPELLDVTFQNAGSIDNILLAVLFQTSGDADSAHIAGYLNGVLVGSANFGGSSASGLLNTGVLFGSALVNELKFTANYGGNGLKGLGSDYGVSSISATAANVPEPATLLLLTPAIATIMIRRKLRK